MMLARLTLANLKMIVRNRQSLFWALAFPLMMVFLFGLIASRIDWGDDLRVTIAVVDNAGDNLSSRLVGSLLDAGIFEVQAGQTEADALRRIEDGDLDFLLVMPEGFQSLAGSGYPAPVTLAYDESHSTSGFVIAALERFLAALNLDMAGASPSVELATDARSVQGSFAGDYKSFILPGMAIWGIMSFSVIGIATSMAGYREKKIFRRIKATPLKARTFFAAQVLAYLALSMVQAAIILGVGALAYGVSISGNILIIGLVIALGNVIFLNLGFLVGTYSKTVSAASGLGNLVVLPMLMTSGIFFPAEYLPDALAAVVRYLPVYPMAEAVRGVALDGMGAFDFPVEFAVMGAWIAATFAAAARLFKFE